MRMAGVPSPVKSGINDLAGIFLKKPNRVENFPVHK